MSKTSTLSVASGAAVAVVALVPCRSITVRENIGDAVPVAYTVNAPASGDGNFHKAPAESTVFTAPPGSFFQANETVGFITQTSGGPITFELFHE